MFKIIYSSPYASHETATSHIVKNWYRYESIMPTLLYIYSRHVVVHWPHVLCLDFVEHTHSSDTAYAATWSTFICADTDTGFITIEQLIYLTLYLNSNLIHCIHLRLCRNGPRFLAANRSHGLTKHSHFYLFCSNSSINDNECQCALYVRRVKYVILYRIVPCN